MCPSEQLVRSGPVHALNILVQVVETILIFGLRYYTSASCGNHSMVRTWTLILYLCASVGHYPGASGDFGHRSPITGASGRPEHQKYFLLVIRPES